MPQWRTTSRSRRPGWRRSRQPAATSARAAEALHARAERIAVYPVEAKARLLALVAKQPGARAMRTQLVADLLSAAHETAAWCGRRDPLHGERAPVARLGESVDRARARRADPRGPEAAADPQARARPPRGARARAVAIDAGEPRRVAGDAPLLRHVRERRPELHRQAVGWRCRVRGARVRRPHERARRPPGSIGSSSRRAPPTRSRSQKTGPGRMYYRIGITYAPKRVDLPALDAGFVVRRGYEPIDHTSDVTTTPAGVRIKLGARVQIVDEVIVTTRRDGVALVDPLPAGLEAVNTSLATAERAAGDDKRVVGSRRDARHRGAKRSRARWTPARIGSRSPRARRRRARSPLRPRRPKRCTTRRRSVDPRGRP